MNSLHPDVYEHVLRLIAEEKKKKKTAKHPPVTQTKKEVECVRRIIKREVVLNDENVVREIVLDDNLLNSVLPKRKPIRRSRIRMREIVFLLFLLLLVAGWTMILIAMLFW